MTLSSRGTVVTVLVVVVMVVVVVAATAVVAAAPAETEVEYGVDVSFPIHQRDVSNNYPWLPHNADPANHPTPREYQDMSLQPLGDRRAAYDEFLQGCKEFYGRKGQACIQTEIDRIEMNLRQPQSMQNYSDTGYKKIKAPKEVFKLLEDFWKKNHLVQSTENWPAGNTYTNHWVAPTYMVSVENSRLRGGGYELKQKIWAAARNTIEEWTGQELTQCSLYGIRVYKEGAVLASHVDRLPLVSSAIINVAQDVDEPWPIEVYGHDGKATNVTMEPGDMVLYESHSVVHGRPFPLKGRFYANIFVHFEPTGHSLRHNARVESGGDVAEKYRRAVEKGTGGHEADHDGLPSYIKVGSLEEKKWRREHEGHRREKKPRSFATGSTSIAHEAAKEGDAEQLKDILDKDGNLVSIGFFRVSVCFGTGTSLSLSNSLSLS